MNKWLPPAYMLSILWMPALVGSIQSSQAQAGTHDSIRNMLVFFHEKAVDNNLKLVIEGAQSMYKGNSITPLLAIQLLKTENMLLEKEQFSSQLISTYALLLIKVLYYVSPQAEHFTYASSLNNLAGIYVKAGKYRDAMPLLGNAQKIFKKALGEQFPPYAVISGNIANLYRIMGAYEKALPLFEQSLSITKNTYGDQSSFYAKYLNDIALLYHDMGQYEKVIPLLQQALTIRKKSGEKHPDYAESLSNLASVYNETGNYELALILYQQALKIIKDSLGEAHRAYSLSLGGLALHYLTVGDYKKALQLNQQLVSGLKEKYGEQHPEFAMRLISLADVYTRLGDYGKALSLYQQATAIIKKVYGEQNNTYALSLDKTAETLYYMGDYEKAILAFQESEDIKKRVLGVEHAQYAVTLNGLAAVYIAAGEYGKGLPLIQQAVGIIKNTLGEAHPDYARSLYNLANCYHLIGEQEKALPLLKQVVQIREKMGTEHPNYANALLALALVYESQSDYGQALPLILQAVSILKATLGEENFLYSNGLFNLGIVNVILGNTSEGYKVFLEADHILLKHLAKNFDFLSEHEKTAITGQVSSYFYSLYSLLYTQLLQDPAMINQVFADELFLKGMVLSDQMQVIQQIRKSNDPAVRQLVEKWQLNRTILGRQILSASRWQAPFLNNLEDETNQLEQGFSGRSAVLRNSQRNQVVEVKDISGRLGGGEACIEFLSFPLFNRKWTDSVLYAAMIVQQGDSVPHFVPLFEEKQLQKLLEPLQNAASSDAIDYFTVLERMYPGQKKHQKDSLYQMVWQPLEKYLNGIHTIYYSPAGLLNRIAFQALSSDSVHLLIDKYRLIQVLNLRSIKQESEFIPAPQSVAIWGDINYNHANNTATTDRSAVKKDVAFSSGTYQHMRRDPGDQQWNYLPFSKQETDSLQKLCRQARLLTHHFSGAKATEEAFKLQSGKNMDIIHLSTHGFSFPRPQQNTALGKTTGFPGNVFAAQPDPMLRSGLVFAGANNLWENREAPQHHDDGMLTAYEIAQLNLSNTRLVVLSACETALGDLQGFEEVVGLQRAFRLAGVKEMIVSLWRVSDKTSMELMTLFYRNMLSGRSTRDALHSAQMTMKDKYKQPFFWAAFVLIQ